MVNSSLAPLPDAVKASDIDLVASDCRATPGETPRADIRQGAGRVGLPSLPASAQNSLNEILNAERRQLEGKRLPSGHRFFLDRERETYARLINWNMSRKGVDSLFGTYTFRDYVSMDKANKMIDRHLARMAEALSHKGGRRLNYVVATEWQQRDVIHFHTMLTANGLGNLSRKRWEARWERSGGGFARLYDAEYGAAPYLAKYMNKSRGGELRLGGAWQGLNPPGALDPVKVKMPGSSLAVRSANHLQSG